ncbi:MAG: ribose transport system substrate-binding protein [Subtercola sp.]|nr:ribose transport system substrate-binding protein [Subtercola sp.]
MHQRFGSRIVPVAAGLIAAALVLGGCSGASAGSGSALGSGSGDLPAAHASVEKFLANPTTVGYDTPVTAAIPTGKRIVALQVAADVMRMVTDTEMKAAADLGWSVDRILVGSGPEDMAKAFDAALDSNPDGIYYSGQGTTAAILPELQQAADRGIPVVSEALGEDRPAQAIAQIRDSATSIQSGKLTADWIADDSQGAAHVLLVDVPSYLILAPYATGMTDELSTVCSDCSLSKINVQLSDIGTTLPSMVASELQRDPKINYVVYGFGDMTIGLDAALSAVGVSDQATMTGQIPGVANIKTLKDGARGAWVPTLSPESGYRAIDAFVRFWTGGDPTIVEGVPAMQILTSKNVGTAVFTDDGYWVGSNDLAEQYKSMWKVG